MPFLSVLWNMPIWLLLRLWGTFHLWEFIWSILWPNRKTLILILHLMHYLQCILLSWFLQCISQSCMELVRNISSFYLLPKQITGCILVFEYFHFLLQQCGDARKTPDLAVKEYQSSGAQAKVLNALQHAIEEYRNDHNALMQAIIDIIVNNHMCKWFSSGLNEVSNDVFQQRSSFSHSWNFSLPILIAFVWRVCYFLPNLSMLVTFCSTTCCLALIFSESHPCCPLSIAWKCTHFCKNIYCEMQGIRNLTHFYPVTYLSFHYFIAR